MAPVARMDVLFLITSLAAASLTRALFLDKAFAGYPGRSLPPSLTAVTPEVHVACDDVNRLHLFEIIRSCHPPT